MSTDGNEFGELEMPIPPMEIAFIEIHEIMQCAIRAGFTEDQAYGLARVVFDHHTAIHYAEILASKDNFEEE